ncbi:helix-turn-helix protein [Streptomyces sp. 3211.6]|uniref:helix-turn-helix domain-containing protein n=1 Tax=Streptomyces TaxID=1883 RepID=UPI0009A51E04|nr:MULTISPECIES: Scr1 family TA system antitoxin-like transcriptional regulator [Streptomyces]RKT05268.1 helix-turn-helix protein [Streptomyces sp. 3211.6]RPF41190.1 helix-turn-helix protein [Streptomyces sp. Ag109_G2-6]
MPPKKRPRPNATTMKMVGKQVATARFAKNLTQKQLADLIKVDEETIGSIEQGRRTLMPNVAELLDFHLALPGLLTVAALELPAVDTTPPWAEEYLALERAAIALSWYEGQRVPGLLQTEGYARALFTCRVPAHPPKTVEDLTARRMARQEILHRKTPPTLSFVIWEPAVRHRIGGLEVHREQLRHLLACSQLPDVSIQVMPLGQPAHAALDGPFILVETPSHQHFGYSESQRGSRLISDPAEVSIMARRYAMLRTQALNTVETQGLLDRLLGDL